MGSWLLAAVQVTRRFINGKKNSAQIVPTNGGKKKVQDPHPSKDRQAIEASSGSEQQSSHSTKGGRQESDVAASVVSTRHTATLSPGSPRDVADK
eukprot:gene2448-8561_t